MNVAAGREDDNFEHGLAGSFLRSEKVLPRPGAAALLLCRSLCLSAVRTSAGHDVPQRPEQLALFGCDGGVLEVAVVGGGIELKALCRLVLSALSVNDHALGCNPAK
jgi:hypothetical protein